MSSPEAHCAILFLSWLQGSISDKGVQANLENAKIQFPDMYRYSCTY